MKVIKDKLKDKLKDNKIRKSEKAADFQISDSNTVASASSNKNRKRAVPFTDADSICKIESVKSVHSELDIKDESPMYEFNSTNHYEQSSYGPVNPQQNYYYMVPPNPEIVPQEAIVQGVPQVPHAAYYMRPYMMQTPQNKFLPIQHQQQPVYHQQSSQIITQPYINNVNYMPYVTTTQPQAEYVRVAPVINQPNPQNPVYCAPKPQNRKNNKSATPRQNKTQHPNGVATRSNNTSIRGRCQKPANPKGVRGDVRPQPSSKPRRRPSQISNTENNKQKVTSLIMLSDSDDEIEMIIMEKTPATTTEKATPTDTARLSESQRIANQSKQKPTITSDIIVPSTKGILSPQIIQRMSQGGISITPVKNNLPPPTTNSNTQLVVVVNETGSHYALALPNGSKLILTPEQVAQIRASNGGKLIL